MTTDQINAATGFANGEQFQSAEEVRAYFTVDNMREMFGLQDGSRYSQDDLDRMAEQVIESGFHCRYEECLQESPERKNEWLRWTQTAWPVGKRCTVVAVDSREVNHYLGQKGTITGYDLGSCGAYPGVLVRLDDGTTDTFYCDGSNPEIAAVPD